MGERDEEDKRNKKKEKLREKVRMGVQNEAQIIKNIQDIQKSAMEAIRAIQQPLIDMQDVFLENMYVFSEINQHITGLMNSIDWEAISEKASERIKEIDSLLQEHEKNFWCLDFEILDAIEDSEMTQEIISEYIDENLDLYIEEIIKDPMYELHVTLIQETYEAYKRGFYKLCAMSLFAAFEHVIASWRAGNIKADVVSIRQKPNVRRLYYKIEPEVYSEIEQEQFTKVFAISVFRMFKKTFEKIPDEICQELNRNSIAHGFYDYDSLTKTDILRLFQLLKSTLVIRYFDMSLLENPKKVAES
ncbi:hypothetical protein CN954_12250 [Bacillus cereus]|uniref:hypothetical protein n=1 Tax=Bacillus cereus TaxID=1396 RepID=UPI000BFCB495|nr:hypothetical protein [Bacillus cereus]PGN13219.1 hypothetical protein CN954_12250 [Bacillus cereus]